jgi:hypothetical protein
MACDGSACSSSAQLICAVLLQAHVDCFRSCDFLDKCLGELLLLLNLSPLRFDGFALFGHLLRLAGVVRLHQPFGLQLL